MNRSLEAGYGSPQCPEVVGMAQQKLQEVKDAPVVFPAEDESDRFLVKRVVPAETLEGSMIVGKDTKKREGVTHEQGMLEAYHNAYSDEPSVTALQSVEDTGMVPPQFGVELGFETTDGDFFTSTGPSVEHAMADGIAYSLLPKEK